MSKEAIIAQAVEGKLSAVMRARMMVLSSEIESHISGPSEYWKRFGNRHFGWLEENGIENFKRSLGHHFGTFLTVDVRHPQIRRLLELWPTHLSLQAFSDKFEVNGSETSVLAKNPLARSMYGFSVSLLWDYTLHSDAGKLLEKLSEPLFGNPLRVMRGDRILSQDLCHSVRERTSIAQFCTQEDLTVCEIGAGYGRLAHVIRETMPCRRYVICDIAPALLVSEWYLSQLYPTAKIFKFRRFDNYEEIEAEYEASDIAFLSSNQLEKLPSDSFDVSINVLSLMEMQQRSIDYYLKEIDRVTRGFFYSKQKLEKLNAIDGIKIRKENYVMPEHWRCLMDKADEVNPVIYEQIWQIN